MTPPLKGILVTGAAGFLGMHLVERLLVQEYAVHGIDNFSPYYDPSLKEARLNLLKKSDLFTFYKKDLCDFNALENVFKEHTVHKVCNLAAKAGVRYSLINPFAYQKSNLEGFLNIIELSKQYRVENFVYASSSSVYGNNTKLPFSVADNVDAN